MYHTKTRSMKDLLLLPLAIIVLIFVRKNDETDYVYTWDENKQPEKAL